jgi:hypothetical protein
VLSFSLSFCPLSSLSFISFLFLQSCIIVCLSISVSSISIYWYIYIYLYIYSFIHSSICPFIVIQFPYFPYNILSIFGFLFFVKEMYSIIRLQIPVCLPSASFYIIA